MRFFGQTLSPTCIHVFALFKANYYCKQCIVLCMFCRCTEKKLHFSCTVHLFKNLEQNSLPVLAMISITCTEQSYSACTSFILSNFLR